MKMNLLSKLLAMLLVLTVIPLVIVALLSAENMRDLSSHAAEDFRDAGEESLAATEQVGAVAVADSKAALQDLAQEAIEVRAQDAGRRVAAFLYERDADARAAATSTVWADEAWMRAFLAAKRARVDVGAEISDRPLYKEIAFYLPNGDLRSKVTAPGYDGKDYALDDFKARMASLRRGDLYVSRLWGDYVLKSEAYAGVEKPDGEQYEGYFRWVAPVYGDGGALIGYLSLKLDSRHVMDLVQHLSPTDARYVALPDAPSGNYAYMVDDEGWLITHAREFHLKGVMPDGTLPPPLSKLEGVPLLLEGTQPLRFGYLSGHSKELDEIHTVHAQNGESGSQEYPWAGLDKWIAYSTVPYYTGANYEDEAGFGWVAVGAEIKKFNLPADATAAKINETTQRQAAALAASITSTSAELDTVSGSAQRENFLFIFVILLLVVIVGVLFARSISTPIQQLKEAADKVSNGDFDVRLPKAGGTDEIAQLTSTMEMMVAGLKARVARPADVPKKAEAVVAHHRK